MSKPLTRSTNGPESRLREALNGDEQAFNGLLGGSMHDLHRVAMRVLGTPEDAEDALQDGLLAAWHKLKTFEGRSQFSTWLTRIVINCSLMHLRRRRAHTVTSMDEPSGETGESIVGRMADPRPTPEEVCAQREQRQILREKLQELPVPYRTALWLCDVKGMRVREAAHVLRIPLGTLKSQVVRGRRMISRQVHEGKALGQ